MTDTEQTPTLPPPGPSGYQPGHGEGVDEVTVTVERDGVTVHTAYVFEQPRPTGAALPAIAELRAALVALLEPTPQAKVPPVAAPQAPTIDPAAGVRPPTGPAPALVDNPHLLPGATSAPTPSLDTLRAGAWGGQQPAAATPEPSGVSDWQQRMIELNAANEALSGQPDPF